MKALSIRQPWAWLVAHGFKPIENRTWNTSFRGEFLIHAGLRFDADAYRRLSMLFPEIKLPPAEAFDRGGIVGKAELVDCLPPGSEPELSIQDRRWYQGDYGFVVANARPLLLCPVKGRLNFFEVPECL